MTSRHTYSQHDIARKQLFEILRRKGIHDERVMAAMAAVPRHEFVRDIFQTRAWEDSALPIACQQTISQPYTVAFMTQALELRGGEKVLEIGTGSGYQACILVAMGCRVFTIERHFELLEEARARFDGLEYNIASKVGDGSVGWSQFAPFDGIIVTAGAPEVPASLLRQLAEGGRLVIPVGDEQTQDMALVRREGNEFVTTKCGGFKFVPLIGKEGWRK